MSKTAAQDAHDFVAVHFGNWDAMGTAPKATYAGVTYLGSEWWESPTKGGNWKGYYGRFHVQHQGKTHSLRMGANESRGAPYLVFVLDGVPTPTFIYRLEGNDIHRFPKGRVASGWWMTHIKHLGLGANGGSISGQRVLATVQRNAPWLRTGPVVDFGGLFEDNAKPLRGTAGFLHRVFQFVIVRNALRDAHLLNVGGTPTPDP